MINTARTAGLATTRASRLNLDWLRSYSTLALGLTTVLMIVLLALVGPMLVDPDHARVGAFRPSLAPDAERILGTDAQGRDVLTTVIVGTPQTLRIALTAGILGLSIGIILGLMAGYFGGPVDTVIRILSDTLITIPGILVLVLIAANVRTMTVELMGVVVACLAWMGPTRTIRSQTLSLRERAYVEVAKLNGVRGIELILREVLPNLLPYIAASFVAAVSGATLASIGLEMLGLGAQNAVTLGMTVYWAQFYGAVLRNMWWWWAPPVVMIVLIFLGLLLTSVGMDAFTDARLRQTK